MSFLIMNEYNFNDLISTSLQQTNDSILFYLDDDIDSLKDLNWIWNTDFSFFQKYKKILCCGKRSLDLVLKLKLDNCTENIFMVENIIEYINKFNPSEIIGSEFSISKLKETMKNNKNIAI